MRGNAASVIMPIEEIVDELVDEVDYDLSSVAEELKEITYALKAGDEKKALMLARGALALLEPQPFSEEDSFGDRSNVIVEAKSRSGMEAAFFPNMLEGSRLWASSILCSLFIWGLLPWFWQSTCASSFRGR